MMLVPGTSILCPTCSGAGTRTRPRAAVLTSRPDVQTMFVEERCKPCRGTGRLPPREPDPDPDPED